MRIAIEVLLPSPMIRLFRLPPRPWPVHLTSLCLPNTSPSSIMLSLLLPVQTSWRSFKGSQVLMRFF